MRKRDGTIGLSLMSVVFLMVFIPGASAKPEKARTLMVDDFERGFLQNSLENRYGIFQQERSFCSMVLGENVSNYRGPETSGHYLILNYEKRTDRSSVSEEGWCGWYTFLKPDEDMYMDLTGYNYLRFYYKSVNGSEDFTMCLADKTWDLMQDSIQLQNPASYFITKRFKSGWREVTVALSCFGGLNMSHISSLGLLFETGKGTVYLDNISFGYDPQYESRSYRPGKDRG
jgi:hypothetical protein